LPQIINIHQIPIFFENFNALSFDGFVANTGDTEGRIAAKNNVQLGAGYSVGYLTKNAGVNGQFTPYALVAGRDLSWGSGAVYPDGSGIPIPEQLQEEIFVGGVATNLPGYLQALVTGTCGTPGCLDASFDTAFNFYKFTQSQFAALPANTQATVQFQGLSITCNDAAATRYVLNVQGDTLSGVTWYTTHGCNLGAVWVINVLGSGNVQFQGDFLPTIAEKTVWNIIGAGRTVTVLTEVRGNMLAPQNTLSQTGGVIKGKVVFGNIAFSLQINLPDCFDLILVRVNDFCAKPANNGDLCVTLVSGGVLAIGDKIAFAINPNVVYTITSTLNKDGTMTVCLDTPLQNALPLNTRAFADINANSLTAGRSDIATGTSPAASVVASFALIVAAIVALVL